MFHSIWCTVRKLGWLILILGVLYVACIGAGVATYHAGPESLPSWVQHQGEGSYEQIERVFGRFRGPLREGRAGTILTCSGLVFVVNMAGDVLNFTLPGALIVPLPFTLLYGGWVQGVGLAGLHASSLLSLLLLLLVGSLEWVSYVLASAAGLNIGLSVLAPRRQGVTSRGAAFRAAWGDAARLYALIALILAVQAVMEILYVRKVLLMGGTGIPLQPY